MDIIHPQKGFVNPFFEKSELTAKKQYARRLIFLFFTPDCTNTLRNSLLLDGGGETAYTN